MDSLITPSLSGARYGLLFTDDVMRWRRIYFLKEKSDALKKLEMHEGDMSALLNDQDIKIARLHSDNGGDELLHWSQVQELLQW